MSARPQLPRPGLRLDHPRALRAVITSAGDVSLARRLLQGFQFWDELARSSPETRARKVGPWAAAVRLPYECPRLPTHLADCVGHVNAALRAPLTTWTAAERMLLWWHRGEEPQERVIALLGSRSPSAVGLQTARSAVKAARSVSAAVSVVAGGPLADAVAKAAAVANVPVLWVAPADPDVSPLFVHESRQLVNRGGYVAWPQTPSQRWDDHGYAAAEELQVLTAHAAVAIELTPYHGGGVYGLRAVLERDVPLVVPDAGYHPLSTVRCTHQQLLNDPDALRRLLELTPASSVTNFPIEVRDESALHRAFRTVAS